MIQWPETPKIPSRPDFETWEEAARFYYDVYEREFRYRTVYGEALVELRDYIARFPHALQLGQVRLMVDRALAFSDMEPVEANAGFSGEEEN